MAQAKLAGRKTNTRRMSGLHEINSDPGRWDFIRFWNGHAKFCEVHNHTNEKYVKCPYGQPGDLLYGRESWNELYNLKGTSQLFTRSDLTKDQHNWQRYLNNEFQKIGYVYAADKNGEMEPPTWKPSIHMPKEAARIWDEVTGIRVERVADISEEDCIAEGIEKIHEPSFYKNYLRPDGSTFYDPVSSFRSLWQSINGTPRSIQSRQKGKLITTGYDVYPFDEQAAAEFQGLSTWRGKPLTVITNPWVWVIETKQLSVTGRP